MQASRQRGITRRLLAATEIQRRAHESGHGFVLADLSALLNP